MTETEIKLSCESLTRLQGVWNDVRTRYPVLAPAKDIRMHSVYFDTADERLHTAGCAIRFRAENDSGCITLKTGAADSAVPGLHVRGEFECPAQSLDEGLPRLIALLPPPLASLLSDVSVHLQPIAEVSFCRSEFLAAVSGAEIAFALDHGCFNHCPSAEFFELEAELKQGSADALSALCAALAESYALSPVSDSKLHRARLHLASLQA